MRNITVLTLCFLIGGCTSLSLPSKKKVFELSPGMSKGEVNALIGNPESVLGVVRDKNDQPVEVWEYFFRNGVVFTGDIYEKDT